jgi:WD40 repeat protein
LRGAGGLLLLLAACGAAAVSQPPRAVPPVGEARRFLGHTHQVNSVTFTRDGTQVVSASIDSTVRLWDVAAGKEARRHEDHSEIVWRVAVSPDGKRVLSGGGGTYNRKTDRFKAGKDYLVRLWAADSLKELKRFKGHTASVRGLAFSPDGKQALSASFDGTLRVWDVEEGKELRCIRLPSGSAALALSPDGKKFVVSNSVRPIVLRVWDLEAGKELRVLKGHTALVHGLAFSPDGQRILSASGDNTARLWDAETGKKLGVLRHASGVTSVEFFPDGRHAITGSGTMPKPGSSLRFVSGPGDWLLRVWDLDKKKQLFHLAGHTRAVMDVRISPDGRQAVSCSSDGTVRLWALPELRPGKKR